MTGVAVRIVSRYRPGHQGEDAGRGFGYGLGLRLGSQDGRVGLVADGGFELFQLFFHEFLPHLMALQLPLYLQLG